MDPIAPSSITVPSGFIIPPDTRNPFWADLELKIQKSAERRDPEFSPLPEQHKKYITTMDGMKVYRVNGPWVHDNLSDIFGHGGHAYVHEFIRHGEIWLAETHHNCNFCKIEKGTLLSEAYFWSTALHEISEYYDMKEGMTYWQAHNRALEKERIAGLDRLFHPDERL